MSHRFAISIAAVIALASLVLVDSASSAPPARLLRRDRPSRTATMSPLVEAGNRFAFDLYERLRGKDGNLFFSPASISVALAMTYAGAAGNTETEMAKTLHLEMAKAQVN